MSKRPTANTKIKILIIWVGWGVWWILAFVQNYQLTNPDALGDTIIRFTLVGLIWAIVTPLVLYFSKVIKYENNIGRLLFLHFMGATLILIIRSLPNTGLLILIFHPNLSFARVWLNVLSNFLVGNYLIYALIAAVHYAVGWFYDYKDSETKTLTLQLKSEQLERQLSDANLATLRMQLNPHFLFNTLNSVASLIRIKNNNEAIETLSTLSELLRSTVYEGVKNEVTIREEVSFIEKYLSIEQLRFSDRLEVFWDVDEQVLDIKIPTFLLQPLVENALKHGLKEKQNGKLNISIKSTPDARIAFLIEDNGLGLPAEKILERNTGVGIKNTVNRLMGTYNDQYEFQLSNNLEMAGAHVKLVLPIVNKV